MPCDTPIFQDWADNGKIKDPTGANGEALWIKPIARRAFLNIWSMQKGSGEAVRDQNPKKFCLGHPINNLFVKVKLHVRVVVLFDGNNHGK